MEDFDALILGLITIVFVILTLRWFGAWMLRIDVVIKHLREVLEELRKINANSQKETKSE